MISGHNFLFSELGGGGCQNILPFLGFLDATLSSYFSDSNQKITLPFYGRPFLPHGLKNDASDLS